MLQRCDLTGNRGYAICTSPASGSELFCGLLARTGVLGTPREYFNTLRCRSTDPGYPGDPQAQMERVLRQGATPNGIYGVELMSYQQDAIAKEIDWLTALPRLRLVYFERRDLLGQAIALLRRMQTGSRAQRIAAGYEPKNIKRMILVIMRERTRWALFFAQNGIDPEYVIYEELVRAPQAAIDRVAALAEVAEPAFVDVGAFEQFSARDEVAEQWRARYVSEYRDPDFVDTIG